MEVHEEIQKQSKRLERLENHFEFFRESNLRMESNMIRIENNMDKLIQVLTGSDFSAPTLEKKIRMIEEKNSQMLERIEINRTFAVRVALLVGIVAGSIIILIAKHLLENVG